MRLGPADRAIRGCFTPVFTRVSEKTTGNSERLRRQTRLGIEPGTYRLPALIAKSLEHWWGPNSHRNEISLDLDISPHLPLRQSYVWGTGDDTGD